jgi:hypothetical protein
VNDDFDLDRLRDVPDPMADVGDWPLPPRPAGALQSSPTRAGMAAMRATALVAALLYELAWIGIMNGRADLHTMPLSTLLLELAIPLATAMVALAAAAGSGKESLGEPKGRLVTLALLSPVLFVVGTFLAGNFVASADMDADSFWPHALRCFLWTSLYALGPVALAAWAFRRSFATTPAWRTAALGMACGAAGAATMSFVCSVGTPAHVIVGHGGIIFVAALGGAALGRRFGQI